MTSFLQKVYFYSFSGMAGCLSGDGEKQKRPGELLNFWQKSQEKANVQRQVFGQIQCRFRPVGSGHL